MKARCGAVGRGAGYAWFGVRLIAVSAFSILLLTGGAQAQTAAPKAHFVGSESCKSCHAATYTSWKQTRMANVVRDPKEHLEAVLGDFLHPDPLVTFGLDQVAFVYGSRWKQRYFTKRGDDYYPLPAQPAVTIATSDYGVTFTAALARDRIIATQFHLEKSGAAGLRLLDNFCRLKF